MNLYDQVVSLELAKRLKELGVKQQSIFGWIYHEHSEAQAWACKHKEPNAAWYVIRGTNDHKPILWKTDKEISAFTSSELGEMLPGMIKIEGDDLFLTMDCDRHPYYQSMNYIPMLSIDTNDEDSEADARAKTLIHLIENGLMKVSE